MAGSNPIEGVMCGSTWSPANSSRAAASRKQIWPRVCPGVGTTSSTRPGSVIWVGSAGPGPGVIQSSGSSQTGLVDGVAEIETRNRSAIVSAPQLRNRAICGASPWTCPEMYSSSDGRSLVPRLIRVPNSWRSWTAWV